MSGKGRLFFPLLFFFLILLCFHGEVPTPTSSYMQVTLPSPGLPTIRNALRGLGSVFRAGVDPMSDLIVAHVRQGSNPADIRLFLRTLHRSGTSAKSDVVFLLPSEPLPFSLSQMVREEEQSFRALLAHTPPGPSRSNSTLTHFRPGPEPFHKAPNKSAEIAWGSILAFEVAELNSDNTLQGFINNPPINLRRWACYQMLLGIFHHQYNHVFLTEASGTILLTNPFSLIKNSGLYLTLEDRAWGGRFESSFGQKRATQKPPNITTAAMSIFEEVYGKQLWATLEESEKRQLLVNSGAIIGGIQHVRGLANAMVTEIVKVALNRKSRNAFPDSVLLSYLLHRSSSAILGRKVMKHLTVMYNEDSFIHSLAGSKQRHLFLKKKGRQIYPILSHPGGMQLCQISGAQPCQISGSSRRWRAVTRIIQRDICSSPVDAAVYSDCQADAPVIFDVTATSSNIT